MKKRMDEQQKSYGEKQEIAWGSQLRSYVLHPYNIVKDPVQDRVVMQEYLETVVRERQGWGDLYTAIHEVM